MARKYDEKVTGAIVFGGGVDAALAPWRGSERVSENAVTTIATVTATRNTNLIRRFVTFLKKQLSLGRVCVASTHSKAGANAEMLVRVLQL